MTTYSGRIFGLTTRPPGSLEAVSSVEMLDRLKTEILELEQRLAEEKEVTELTGDHLAPLALSVSHRYTTIFRRINIQYEESKYSCGNLFFRMNLDKETASYLLSIELDSPIDNVLIQSDTPVELLDESKSSVMSFSACNPHEGNFVLATYRCQVMSPIINQFQRQIFFKKEIMMTRNWTNLPAFV